MNDLFDLDTSASGATFSPCRQWRYRLWRRWSEKPAANFLMLNPSTADELKLDPTCARCASYAREWGYGGLVVTNLFAWRATDPADMKAQPDPVGPDNDWHIIQAAREARIVICAWGNHGEFQRRVDRVLELLAGIPVPLHALKLNGTGQPAHPLYLPSSLKPIAFNYPNPL